MSFSTFTTVFLIASFPALSSHASDSVTDTEACRELIRGWAETRAQAQAELAACNLRKFHEFCGKLPEARAKVLAQGSPCLKLPQSAKFKTMPELNCNIVKVPATCGEK